MSIADNPKELVGKSVEEWGDDEYWEIQCYISGGGSQKHRSRNCTTRIPMALFMPSRWITFVPQWARTQARRTKRWHIVLFMFFWLSFYYCFHRSPPQRHPSSQVMCPNQPPNPPIVPELGGDFNWRVLAHRYPVRTFATLPTGKRRRLSRVQYEFEQEQDLTHSHKLDTQNSRREAVKESFTRSWQSYKQHAWAQDELQPVSGNSVQTLGGWGVTLVDSVDTLWIMGMKEEFREAVNAISKIDFKPESVELNLFEVNIRYLGGLLSAYDLTECKDYKLLEKALEVADMIYASFDTTNRMPVTRWNPEWAANGVPQSPAREGIIAEMASFSMEFTRLSQLTGDMRYYDAVSRITDILDSQQSDTKLPGLWPVNIDLQTPDLTKDTQFSLGARADSAYEYLAKTYQLLHGVGSAVQYQMMYEFAMDSVIKHLLFRPMVPDEADILMPGVALAHDAHSVALDPQAQHLSCYAGGMLALGGRLVQNETYVEYGRKVTDGCVWAYRNAPNGIMPETSTMTACPSHDTCAYNGSLAQVHPGFKEVSDPRYLLRPETIESVFYMYRITGDSAYQDIAWDMFQKIERMTRTNLANAGIENVMVGNSAKEDKMESYWLSGSLKYFYLIFSPPGEMSLDDWVFNTEAHPFRLEGTVPEKQH
ncbi:glycoside hydrolase family 47 protein [Periconia macrospinosa]|uniref:alpha-1,2-Mannosidase n=1 Tax=Periconia macrospinosa TaxID=97972 RepID=A0A2V1DP49_9PLEO|nr:glycoside hydrolase family 47 protein [Periconia macrospinosa]